MIRLKKFLKYYDYYLEILAKRISGRGLMDPRTNGEYNLLESIVRNSKDSIGKKGDQSWNIYIL